VKGVKGEMNENDDINGLSGIGPKRAEYLRQQGIHTIRDLIEKGSSLPNEYQKFVREARKVSTSPASIKPMNPEKPDLDVYCLERHSWFDQVVRIPVLSRSSCVEAKVHELAMIPGANQWIGFVCERTENTDSGQKIIACSVTPAALLHFNPHLPALILHVREDESHVLMANVPSLKAVMYELNCMRNVPVIHP